MRDSKSSGKKPIQEVQAPRAHKAKLERLSRKVPERKRVEEELKQSKEFLANVINALDDPVFVKDEQHRWAVLNDAACEVMGRPREELIGKTDYDLFPKEQADVFWERDNSVLKSGETDVNEEEITWHGKLHTISTKKSVFTDSLTGKKFIAGTIRDITERKRAEEALRQSREELQKHNKFLNNILESLTHPFYVIDANDYTIKMANSATSSGRLKEDTTCFAFTHNRDVPCGGEEHSCPLKEIKKTKKPVTIEHIHHDGGGKERYVEVHGYPIFDSRGNVTGIIEYSLDITKRKKAEEELKKSKDLLEKTFLSLNSAVFILDSKKPPTIIECNPAATGIFGYEKEEVVSKTAEFLHVSPETLLEFQKRLYPAIQKEGHLSFFEFQMKRKNGQIFPTEHSVFPLKDNKGNRTGWVSVVRDITERKKAEEAYRSLVDHSLQGLAILQDGRVVFANQAMAEITGYTVDEMLSLPTEQVQAFVYPEDRALVWSRHRDRLDGKPLPDQYEFRGIRKDGSACWLELHASLIEYQGRPAIQVAYVDITERKKAEEALRESEERYKELANSITDIFFAMDKDLRYTYWNKASEKLTGISAKDAIGKSIFEIFPDTEDTKRSVAVYREVLRTQQPQSFVNEYQLNGKDFFFEINAYPSKQGLSIFVKDITERKRVEKALRASEQRFRDVAESTGEWIWEVDTSGLYTYASPVVEKILGYKQEELVGKMHFYDLFTPDVRKDLKEAAFEVFSRRETFTKFVNPNVHKNGNIVFLETSGLPVLDKKGNFLGYRGADADITDRKQAEEALRESQENYRMVSRLTSDYIVKTKVEPNGQMVFVSATDRLEKMTGYAVEKLRSQSSWSKIVHPDDFDKFQDFWKRIVSSRKPCELEFRGIDRKQQFEWLQAYGQPILDEKNDRVISIVFAAKDITERKRAEEALRESEDKYRSFVERANDGVAIIQDSFLKFANARLADMLGYELKEMTGAEFVAFIAPEDQNKLINRYKKRLAGEEIPSIYEATLLKKNGQRFPVEVNAGLIQYQDKVADMAFVRDITERKKAEKKLLDYQGQLKALASQLTLAEERERRRIATELHDQISQSLVISKMKVESLRESASGKELNKALDEVCNSLGRTIAETRSLIYGIHPPLLALLGFEEAVAEWLSEQIQKKHGIEAEFEDDGLPKPLDDDIRILLFRDVRELLTNVVRHAHAHKVKVSIRKVGSQISVSVEDDGVGFDPAEVASIGLETNGFGLFSIQERLEELGGHLEIEFEPGHGAKVTIMAPLKSEKNAEGRKI